MITKTDKYKVKINTPWVAKGTLATSTIIKWKKVSGKPKMSDFPDLFDPVYKLEDETEVCIGDLVWREKNGTVKQVQFNQIHIDKNSKIFGNSKNCEDWLAKNANNIRAELLKQNRESSFQTLKVWINRLDELEKLSYGDLVKVKDGLKTCISNIEKSV